MKTLLTTVIVVFALGSMKAQHATHAQDSTKKTHLGIETEIETRYSPSLRTLPEHDSSFAHTWEVFSSTKISKGVFGATFDLRFEETWHEGKTERLGAFMLGPSFTPQTTLKEFVCGIGVGAGFITHTPISTNGNGNGHHEEPRPSPLRGRIFLNFGNTWNVGPDTIRSFLIEASAEYRGSENIWYSLHSRYSPGDKMSVGFIIQKDLGLGLTISYDTNCKWGSIGGWASPFLYDVESETFAFALALRFKWHAHHH